MPHSSHTFTTRSALAENTPHTEVTPINPPKFYPLEEALKAQHSLREAAGLGPEQFPIQAFVGMISDEIESLREHGQSDEQIVALIQRSSAIQITAAELAEHYAPPEERHQHGD